MNVSGFSVWQVAFSVFFEKFCLRYLPACLYAVCLLGLCDWVVPPLTHTCTYDYLVSIGGWSSANMKVPFSAATSIYGYDSASPQCHIVICQYWIPRGSWANTPDRPPENKPAPFRLGFQPLQHWASRVVDRIKVFHLKESAIQSQSAGALAKY